MDASTTAPPPIPLERLQAIVDEACGKTLADAHSYDHELARTVWNNEILKHILDKIYDELEKLADEDSSKNKSPSTPRTQYKFTIHSSIIQHSAPVSQVDPATKAQVKDEIEPSPAAATAATPDAAAPAVKSEPVPAGESHRVVLNRESRGKRGMHVATCALWNPALDGVWNTSYEPGEGKDWDVLISIMWLSY